MADRNIYQLIRTEVKKQLHHVVDLVNMEPAIRASTPHSVQETEAALKSYLGDHGFHVIHETDVKAIHNHYDLDYPEFKILKVVRAEQFADCPMASRAVEIDPAIATVLPPSIVIYESDDETRVSAIRPTTLLAVVNDPELRGIIRELEGHLWTALEEGVPDSTMLSESPPLPPGEGEKRATIKKALFPVLRLLDAEYTMHVSTETPASEVKAALTDALSRRGQKVLGEVAGGSILLAVNAGQAHKALAIDPDFAVFAPLSVSISQEGGRTHVRTVRPTTLLIFYTHPALQDIIEEIEMLLWNSLMEVPGARVESRQPPLPPGHGQRTTGAGLPGGLDSLRKYRPDELGH